MQHERYSRSLLQVLRPYCTAPDIPLPQSPRGSVRSGNDKRFWQNTFFGNLLLDAGSSEGHDNQIAEDRNSDKSSHGPPGLILVLEQMLEKQGCHVDTVRDIACFGRDNLIFGHGQKLASASQLQLASQEPTTHISDVDKHE